MFGEGADLIQLAVGRSGQYGVGARTVSTHNLWLMVDTGCLALPESGAVGSVSAMVHA